MYLHHVLNSNFISTKTVWNGTIKKEKKKLVGFFKMFERASLYPDRRSLTLAENPDRLDTSNKKSHSNMIARHEMQQCSIGCKVSDPVFKKKKR